MKQPVRRSDMDHRVLPANTSYLPSLPTFPQMVPRLAHSTYVLVHLRLLLIYRPWKDKRLSWPWWLTYSRRFAHISGHPSAQLKMYCGKTAGWVNLPLGTVVGLGQWPRWSRWRSETHANGGTSGQNYALALTGLLTNACTLMSIWLSIWLWLVVHLDVGLVCYGLVDLLQIHNKIE